MICKYCGNVVEDKTAVCPFCGRKLELPKSNFKDILKEYFGSISLKKWIGVVISVLLLISIIISFSFIFRKDPYSRSLSGFFYITENNNNSFFLNGNRIEGVFEGEIDQLTSSFDGNELLFVSGDGDLYLVNRNGIRLVSDSVISYRLSKNGSTVVFVNTVGELYLCKLSGLKSKLIDYNVISSNYVISPDGGSISYLKTLTNGEMMYCYNGKSNEYALDRTPVMITNGCKEIYSLDGSNNFYYKSGKSDEIMIKGNVDNAFYTDSDYGSVLFDSQDRTYLFDGELFAFDYDVELVLVPSLKTINKKDSDYFDNNFTIYGIDNFKNKIYLSSKGDLLYFDGKTVENIDDHVSSATATLGNRVVYLKENSLFESEAKKDKAVLIDENVQSFVLNPSCNLIVWNTESGLYCKGSFSGKTLIDTGVARFVFSGKDYLFYSKSGDTDSLFVTKSAGPGRLVVDNCTSYAAGGSYAYYTFNTEMGKTYYISNGNDRFNTEYSFNNTNRG